jgi:amino acid adenylation domain-containing protein/non-ribosomal peptide synthase protein (TIGR01720 family)
MKTGTVANRIKTCIAAGFSLPEAFLQATRERSDAGIIYVADDGREESLSYAELLAAAERVLGGLREAGMTRGDKLVIQLENELHFAVTFWAALLGGYLPVPVAVPASFHPRHPGLQKLLAVCRTLDRFAIVTADGLVTDYAACAERAGLVLPVLRYDQLQSAAAASDWTSGSPGETAFLMYSSGSTGQAKGVMLSHANLLHNVAQIAERSALCDSDRSVTWLPYTHDMGLILFHLTHCLSGIPQVKTSSLGFMKDPLATLRLIDRHRATLTGQPNFAFEHMLRSIGDEHIAGLDLSCLRLIYNGAEPISAALCHEFARRFAAAGLQEAAISPGYGIAEACVCATQHASGSRLDREICPVLTVSRRGLAQGIVAEVVGEGEDALPLVNLGPPMDGMVVRVLDDDGTSLPEMKIGNLQISGPNVTRGYYGAPDDPRVLAGGWLETGDLGFIADGNVFITGRKKDVIFINGQNFYAHDVEHLIAQETALESGQLAVCGYRSPDLRQERVAVFVRANPDDAMLHQFNRVKSLLATALNFEVHRFVPLPVLPRTSSGKLQRFALVAQLERGEFEHIAAAVASRMAALRTVIAPATPLERALLAVCVDCCKVPAEQASVDWTFAEFAGDSLKLVDLLTALQVAHPDCAQLRLRDLHRHNTVRELAKTLENGLAGRDEVSLLQPVSGDRHRLSRQQQDLWLLQQLSDNGAEYHEAYCCDLNQVIDLARFERALAAALTAHSALRTRFVPTGGGLPEQMIEAQPGLDFVYLDFVTSHPGRETAAVERCVRELATRPFALATQPPCRFALLRTGSDAYTFFVCAHHLVIDGWGFRQLFRTLQEAYSGAVSVPETYRPVDYYAWVASRRGSADYREAGEHWRHLMAQPSPSPILGDPDGAPGATAVAAYRVGRESVARMHAVARRWGVTPYQLALAAYLMTLARVSGTPDIAVGITVAGRSEPAALPILGYLANTLAVRVDVRQLRTAFDLAREVRRQVEAALRFQDFPLSEFVAGVSEGGRPRALYAAAFSLLDSPLAVPGPLAFRHARRLRGGAKLDLLLNIEVEGDDWVCYWEYDAGRIAEPDVDAWHRALLSCWESFGADDEVLLNRLRLQNPGAVSLVDRLALAPRKSPRLPLVTDYFEEQAARHPERTAVTYGDSALSYGELKAKVNALAVFLRELGVRPETRVLVLLPKGVDLVVVTLAVVKAGGAYVPCDTEYPCERIERIAAKAKPRALITTWACLAGLDVSAIDNIVCLDACPDHTALSGNCCLIDSVSRDILDTAAKAPPLPSQARSEDALYVHFTSGTTGEPKGIVNSHRSVCHLIDWYAEHDLYREGDQIPQLVSYAFEAFAGELFPALAVGATLHVMPTLKLIDPSEMLQLFAEKGIAVATLSPSYARQLFRMGTASVALPALRMLMFGGEALLPAHVTMLRAALHPGVELINAYGPTEATVHATWYRLPPGSDEVCIGAPLPGKKLIVVDRCGLLCGPGEPGEMWIGGEGLAVGYLDDEAQTRRAFVQFEAVPGRHERFYRTGDLGVLDENGNLHFLGRIDNQVKINGQRVELEEVEKILADHPQVREAAVVTEPFRAGQLRLAGCYCADSGIDPQELAEFMRRHLPAYMVPTRFVRLPEMPKSFNAKVDRKAVGQLLAANRAQVHETDGEEVPMRHLEVEQLREQLRRIVADAWKKVLGVSSVEDDSNFFTIGGDSILALELVSTLTQSGLRLAPKDVFGHPTLVAQVALLAAAVPVSGAAVEPDEAVSGTVALTPIQHWFFAQDYERPDHWHQSLEVGLDFEVDAEVLRAALLAVVNTHDQLRAIFNRRRQGVQQFVREPGWGDDMVIEIVDAAASADHDCALVKLRDRLAGAIDLSKNAYAVGLAKLGDASYRLVWVIHHLVVDTVSWRILVQDLQAAYAQASRGETPLLPRRTTAYRAYADRLEALAADRQAALRRYEHWRRLVADSGKINDPWPELSAADLPLSSFGTHNVAWDHAQTAVLLAAFSGQRRAQLQDVLLASFCRALGRWSGRSEIAIDLESHGRTDPGEGIDLTRSVGWFTALYPLSISLTPAETPIATLRRVCQARAALPEEGAGFGVLRYLCAEPEVAAAFDNYTDPAVNFNFLGQVDRLPAVDGWRVVPSAVTNFALENHAPYKLIVQSFLRAGELNFELSASQHIATQERLAELAALVRDEARALAAAAQQDDFALRALDFELMSLPDPVLARLPRESADVYPMSPMQEAMFFHTVTNPDSALYHEQTVYRAAQLIVRARLEQALACLVARHEMLRTVFRLEEGAPPLQIVLGKGRTIIDERSLAQAGDDEVAARAEIAHFLDEERHKGRFELSTWPLFRLTLFSGSKASYLAFSFHHILLDGWSQASFIAELYQAYQDSEGADNAPAGRPTSRYKDYLKRLQQAAGDRGSQAFWIKALAGMGYNELPLDAKRPEERQFVGEKVHQLLDVEVVGRLDALARELAVTVNAVCLAAYCYFLHALSGDDDVLTGVVTSGRFPDMPDASRMLGCFLNTFPFRLRVERESATFRDLALAAHQFLGAAREHEHVPLKDILRWVQPHAAAREPFNNIYAFENYPSNAAADQGLELIDGYDMTNFDLTTVLVKRGESLRVMFEYAPDVIRGATAQRWLDQYCHLLDVLAANADRPVAGLDLLPAEQHALLARYNTTARAYDLDCTLHDLFVLQARRAPARVAVSDGTVRLDYARVDAESNRLAWALADAGIGANDFVAVIVPRRPEAMIGFLGVLKAGGAYVPIDPAYPAERILTIIADAGAKAIVTVGEVLAGGALAAERLPTVQRIVLLDDAAGTVPARLGVVERSEWQRGSDEPLPTRCKPSDLAYVIYTSGSTGQPKGVMIRHRSAVNTIHGINELFEVGETDKILCFSSFCFDLSVYDLFGSLAAGATMVLASEAQIREPDQLFDLMAQEGATVWNSVPTGMNQLLGTLLLRSQIPSLDSLRLVMLSGEFIPLALPNDIGKVFPKARSTSLGGATEGSIWSIHYPISEIDPNWKSIPYGYPLPNQGYYVLNEAMQHCLVDQVGMLYIVGEGVAAGYFNDAEKTARAFVRDPFCADGDAVIYRTGDLGRMRGDGYVEILGRADLQVKVRGYRIELGEIENQLSLMPGLRESAAVVVNEGGHNRLVAFYATDNEEIGGEQIKVHLQAQLPDYMVPSQFLCIDRLPVNTSGKVDRKQLIAMLPAARASVAAGADELPRTDLERCIAEVWQNVLRIERVGVNDNFFVLGGDSILCLQVAAGLAQQQVSIRPSDIFRRPTVAQLAEFIEQREAGARREAVDRDGPIELAPIQRWFLRDLKLGKPEYWHLSMELEIDEAVDHERMVAALLAVVNHHDALRCRLQDQAGERMEQQPPFQRIDVAFRDFVGISGALEQAQTVAQFGRLLRENISFAEGPLFSVGLARLELTRYRLTWVVHHLLVDGVSWRILLEDLQRAYQSPSEPLPAKTSGYGAWTESVGQALADRGATVLAPWRDDPLLDRPRLFADPADPRNTEAQSVTVTRRLDVQRTRDLLTGAHRAYRTDVQDLLIAALMRSFWTLTGGTGFVVDLEHHGRSLGEDRLDLSRTVGWFTAIYPLAVSFGPDADPGELIATVKDKLRGIGDKAPYHMASAYSGSQSADAARRAGADILFNYLGDLDRVALGSGWKFAEASHPDRAGENRRSHVLDVSAHIADGALHIQASAVPALMQEGFGIEGWIDAFQAQLLALLNHCMAVGVGHKTSSDFPLLLPDRKQLMRLQDNVADAYPLSAMQEGMYFNARAYPGSPMYHVHAGATLRAQLDVPRLEEALNRVAEVTDILRTVFVTDGFEQPIQVVLERVRYRIEVLENVTPDEVFASLGDDVLDMSRWPNMVFKVIRLGDDTYQLVQFFHHLLMDGWSNAILFSRIMDEYERLAQSRSKGTPLPAPRPNASGYRDFVAFQREAASHPEPAAFWREYLAGAEMLELPVDRAPREPRRFLSRICDYSLEGELRAALRSKARELSCTVSDLLLTAYTSLLHVLTGRTDLVIGYSASIRPAAIPGSGEMIGMFLNTVPLRVPVVGHRPLLENIAALRESHMRCREFEEFPLPLILRAVRSSAGSAEDALFRVLYTSEVYPGARLAEGMQGLGHYQWHMTEFDLALVYSGENDTSIHIKIAYADDLFNGETIEEWFALFRELCWQLAGPAQGTLDEFKQARLITALPVAAPPAPIGFLQRFLHAVTERGDALAVRAKRSLSYRELDAESDAVARTVARFTPPGPVLLDIADDGALHVAAIVGCLKAGRPFVPVPPERARAGLENNLQELGAVAVITDRGADWRQELAARYAVANVIEYSDLAAPPASGADVLPGVATPRGDAYILFTSGSTGRPKGVRIGIPALDHFVDWYARNSGMADDDCVAHLLARHFDASLSELLPALAVGATVDAETSLDALSFADLERYVAAKGITVLTLPAEYFSLWMRQRASPLGAAAALKRLRLLAVGGSPLRADAVERWQVLTGQQGKQVPVLNVYGLTEAAIASSAYLVDRPLAELFDAGEVDPLSSFLPIGRRGGDLEVIDASLRAPESGVGEVVLCGEGLMDGYLNGSGAGAIALRAAKGRRWLHTGDVALVAENGLVTVLGRTDRLLKVRGYRVNPLDIEAALLLVPGVTAALVVLRDERLVAYCVMAAGVDAATVKAGAAERLPSYLVPVVVPVSNIPLTASGKPDLGALAALSPAVRPAGTTGPDATLAALGELAERLIKQPVEPGLSFFEQGGDSLLAAVLADAIERRFGASLQLGEVVRAASLHELADLVAARSEHVAKRSEVDPLAVF